MQGRLVKYCCKAHNVVLGSPFLQLGTFDYYRGLDPNSAIADPEEATHSVNFREGVETAMNNDTLNRVFGGGIGISEGDLTIIAGPEARFTSFVGNAYIFCTSIATADDPPSIDRGKQLNPDYDSMWEITDPLVFRDTIGSALLDIITIDNLVPEARSAVLSLPIKELTLQVQMLDKPVQYFEKRGHKVENSHDIDLLPDHKDALAAAIFQKDKKDAYQREYRFAFMVTHPRLGHLSVMPDPILIPLNRLHHSVSAIVTEFI